MSAKKKVQFQTPIIAHKKRLGLRRASSTIFTPPLTDSKFNYGTLPARQPLERLGPEFLRKTTIEELPTTPSSSSGPQLMQSCSTGYRPYRMALSKRVREKQSKKRLQFYLENELEQLDAVGCQSVAELGSSKFDRATTTVVWDHGKSKTELISEIKESQRGFREHERKKQALKADIEMWKSAFVTAVDELQSKLTTHVGKSALLEQLHIPQCMLKYVND